MTDEAALHAAILAAPDDDLPRLVYADWLDDNGDPARAEFIRLQCRLARANWDDPAAAERADELEDAHRRRWLTGLPQGPKVAWNFTRGFPEGLDLPAGELLKRYERFAAVPWVRELCVREFYGPESRDFASRAWSPSWVGLELWGMGPAGRSDARAVAAVANSPQARQLRCLRFLFFEFDAAAVEALAASPHLEHLQHLDVPDDPARPLFAPLRARFGDRLTGGAG